jgi:predicted DNA-binding transcriptional regulator AlpA
MAARPTHGPHAMHARSTTTADPAELLTRAEAARLCGLAPSTLARYFARNIGPKAVKLGGNHRGSRVRYPRAALLAWIADPAGFAEPARPAGLPRFEPPRRGRRPRHIEMPAP